MSQLKKETIENFREAMGTLPSQNPVKNYDYVSTYDPNACYVKLVEYPSNIYKYLVRMSASTWGDGQLGPGHGSTQKWEKLTPEARYIVALSVLTGNTLPVAEESANLLWEFNGFQRHTYDQFVRLRIGSGHASIGCRDNNKLDCPWILYPELYEELQKNPSLKSHFDEWTKKTKDLYEEILATGRGSWQMSREVLPMSYSHSWTSYTSLLALIGQMNRRLMPCEEAPIVLMFWRMREEIAKKFPLIGNYLRPVCDKAKRCVYHGGAEGLTKYFSNLFAGCGRWKDEADYQEFNFSCTNTEELAKHCNYVQPTEWINYTENDYDKLSDIDKRLFEER
jgi:hypothetical protein